MALFTKGGGDSIDIAGHKIPIQLIGGIAAVAGVLLVLRARKGGQNVAAVGTPAANTGVNPVIDSFSSTSPDISGQLSNITQQLTNLGQTGINSSTPTQSTPPIYGNLPGTDQGFYFGAAPSTIPAGKQLAWRYTSDFVAAHPTLPGVNSNLGLGYGPPPGTPGSQYAYSWEWTLVPV